MPLDHRRLTVYRVTLQLLAMIDEIVEQLPPGRAHLKDQLDRAATTIVLNVAEGASWAAPNSSSSRPSQTVSMLVRMIAARARAGARARAR